MYRFRACASCQLPIRSTQWCRLVSRVSMGVIKHCARFRCLQLAFFSLQLLLLCGDLFRDQSLLNIAFRIISSVSLCSGAWPKVRPMCLLVSLGYELCLRVCLLRHAAFGGACLVQIDLEIDVRCACHLLVDLGRIIGHWALFAWCRDAKHQVVRLGRGSEHSRGPCAA